jgi:hypothetical protein
MSHFPADHLHGEYATDEQRTKRLAKIQEWLGNFADHASDLPQPINISYIPNAAEEINSLYWEALEGQVRPRMVRSSGEHKVVIDHHKIASLTELCVARIQPIEVVDDETQRLQINASLAFYMALNLIGNWNAQTVKTLEVSESFNREHLTWLMYLNNHNDFPIFSNAATWYLVEEYCLLKSSTMNSDS